MGSKRLKTKLFSKKERNLWNNLEINIDSYCDKWEQYEDSFFSNFGLLDEQSQIKICNHYKIKFDKIKNIPKEIYKDKRIAIEVFCIIEFALNNPKAISEIYNIHNIKTRINKSEVIFKVFDEKHNGDISGLFVALLKHRYGKGFFTWNFMDKLKEKDFNTASKFMSSLAVYLKRHDKYSKFYKFRWSYKNDYEWVFLLLKESSDKLYPAIPQNVRLWKGVYKLITIYPKQNRLEINTRSKWEAYRIKDYISKKLKNKLSHKRIEFEYSPKSFFSKLTEECKSCIKLIDAKFKKSNANVRIAMSDYDRKNDIVSQIKLFKDKNMLSLEDLSEFDRLVFRLNDGLTIAVDVNEDRWGQSKLDLIDRNILPKDLDTFSEEFEKRFDIKLNCFLKSKEKDADKRKIVDKIMNSKTINVNMPNDVEEILLDLIEKKIINKPTKTAKRRCEKCRKISWAKGDCPACGNNLLIEGNYINIIKNKTGIFNYFFQAIAQNTDIDIKKNKKQIKRSSYKILDLMDTKKELITIYMTTGTVPENISTHYSETGLPLLVVLTQYKKALMDDILKQDFECISLADFYVYEKTKGVLQQKMNDFVVAQKQKWLKKITQKGLDSFKNLKNKGTNYGDQDFERDIFNIMHEMFYVGDRLGGKFAGIPAPDGIISIQNYKSPLGRYCLAWDCKYSQLRDGYVLRDKPMKHRKYIHSLKNDIKVKLFGGLSTYAIISNKMNMEEYTKFIFKFTSGFRWKGNVLFISKSILVRIYEVFKENQDKILNHPKVFYSEVHRLFSYIWKKDSDPYAYISEERFKKFLEELKEKYSKVQVTLKFKRTDF
ncbi:hypothetical protein K9M79_06355 [Candidatus Woesearchaeota archaeon]|nr:hypothetical protein [Candidatus Woesearchaeota archaeon]